MAQVSFEVLLSLTGGVSVLKVLISEVLKSCRQDGRVSTTKDCHPYSHSVVINKRFQLLSAYEPLPVSHVP